MCQPRSLSPFPEAPPPCRAAGSRTYTQCRQCPFPSLLSSLLSPPLSCPSHPPLPVLTHWAAHSLQLSEKPLRASMQGRSPRASPAVLPLPPWPRSLSGLLHSTLSHLTRLSYEQINHPCKELSQLAPSTSSCGSPPNSGDPGPAHFFQGHSRGTPREVRKRHGGLHGATSTW